MGKVRLMMLANELSEKNRILEIAFASYLLLIPRNGECNRRTKRLIAHSQRFLLLRNISLFVSY